MLPSFLKLSPAYREYVWGGQRLRPGTLTAEAWIVHESDQIADGPLAGKTLAEVTNESGEALLGKKAMRSHTGRFPILIKLLDCNQWLSVQVHPDDKQAVELEGQGQNGKTEAWYILDADPKAQIIGGLKPGTSAETLATSIQNGTILDIANYLSVQKGDTVFMRAGTIHALGPGLFVYEVQQSSDITYRVFDWNRPQTGGRVLHIDKSLRVANPSATSQAIPTPSLKDNEKKTLIQSEYFTLEIVSMGVVAVELDTAGESFHVLTVIEGGATVSNGREEKTLQRFETLLVPAATGSYKVTPQGGCRLLKASL
jgi:mannose-6-phosphate isomerase